MACSLAPASRTDLCANAAACVASFTKDKNYVDGMSIECDGPDRADVASAYSAPAPAPAASGLNSTSLVTMVAVRDWGSYAFGASYLVADFANGSCLIDVLHDWDKHSTYPDTTFATEWQQSGRGYRLQVRSRQVLHEILDREELAEGESDVRADYCQRITYDVLDGRFTRLAESSSEGSCGDEK